MSEKPRRARPAKDEAERAERRAQILAAALDAFAREGYGATRLEDVARAAGVAKGTLYLYFPHKQALFEAIVKERISPVLLDVGALLAQFPGDTRALCTLMAEMLISRIIEGPGQAILRLMIAEGPRFPDLAAFHHGEVVSRGLDLVRAVMARGLARGDITSDAAVRFPQLVFAPAMTSVVWNALFGHLSPLDVRAFVTTYLDVLLRGLGEAPGAPAKGGAI
ncbi:TetR/AcrR family transcriptional regulator [Aquabacter cavernae]|uniref:TetR/AcrR family transcriptional regulator n=1 Tax=Aquabacter cavernae TaxID=2496029 RepID=UPI001FE1D18E|nr:TetR/AcrR family transcriptional regulator [Aquabacter cavernae]